MSFIRKMENIQKCNLIKSSMMIIPDIVKKNAALSQRTTFFKLSVLIGILTSIQTQCR